MRAFFGRMTKWPLTSLNIPPPLPLPPEPATPLVPLEPRPPEPPAFVGLIKSTAISTANWADEQANEPSSVTRPTLTTGANA